MAVKTGTQETAAEQMSESNATRICRSKTTRNVTLKLFACSCTTKSTYRFSDLITWTWDSRRWTETRHRKN